MSKTPWLLASVLLLAASVHAADVFTSDGLFPPLRADPRETQVEASYYTLQSKSIGDVALGRDWGLTRWDLAHDRKLQWGIGGLVESRFKLGGGVNQFQAADFIAQLPVDFRHDGFASRLMVYHESSHLGDDYIRSTGDLGFRYSVEGLRAIVSQELHDVLRVYGGGSYLLHSVPAPQRGTLQAGFELFGPEKPWLSPARPIRFYLAEDVQSRENVQWNVNSRTVFGVRVRARGSDNAIRFHIGHYEGHSPYGQFYLRKESYNDVGLSFDF